MTLQSAARAAFANIKNVVPNAVVTVKYEGQRCEGTRSTETAQESLGDMGQNGVTIGMVRVDASEMTQPTRGEGINVAGEDAMVLDVRKDAVGAFLLIEYQVGQEVELV